VAVEYDRFTGTGIDRRDEHHSLRPVLAGQPGGDRSAALRLPGAVRRRIHFERRRAHFAAHVGRILGGGDDAARYLHVVRRRPHRNASAVGSDRTSPLLGRGGKDGGKQFGRLALVIWAAAVDPADVPMIRSASVTSSPASSRPATTPISHALPADPPPWRTSARSPVARIRLVASICG